MATLDAAAIQQLGRDTLRPVFFAYLDILGDPVRATTAGHDVTLPTLPDPDLSGKTFLGVDPRVVSIGDVSYQEGGSDTLAVAMSGLILPDNDLLNTIAVKANWQGRPARLWVMIRDEDGVQQGAIAPYYTGYMMSLTINPSPEGQTITLEIENYKALLTSASNRTYLDQAAFDPADQSARATIGAANNARTGPGASIGTGGGGSFGGGGGDFGGGWDTVMENLR